MQNFATNGIVDQAGVVRRAVWPTAEFSDVSNFVYTEDPDVIIVNGPGTPNVGVFNTATRQMLWKKPYRFLSGVTYNPHTRRILGYAIPHCALLELDLATGDLVRSLAKTELGPLGHCTNVHYAGAHCPRTAFQVYTARIEYDPNLVLVADSDHHIAGMLHLDSGQFHWRFGEYNVPGNDLRHLAAPRDVAWTMPGGAWIADYANHRLLGLSHVADAPEATHLWLFPRPTSVSFTYTTPGSSFISANAAVASEHNYQPLTLVLSDFDEVGLPVYTSLLGWVPIASNQVTFNPWDPSWLQVNQWNSAFEVNWLETASAWRQMTRFVKPYARQQVLSAGSEWSSEPITGLLNERMLVKIFADTTLHLQLEVPEPAMRLLAVPTDFRWVPAGELTIPAGVMTLYPIEFPPAVFRLTLHGAADDAHFSVYVEGL